VTLEHPIHGEIDRVEREWCRSREPLLLHWDWRVIARSFAEHFMLRVEDDGLAPMTIQEQSLEASTERLDGFREEEEEAT
jgi:hypothetical protein